MISVVFSLKVSPWRQRRSGASNGIVTTSCSAMAISTVRRSMSRQQLLWWCCVLIAISNLATRPLCNHSMIWWLWFGVDWVTSLRTAHQRVSPRGGTVMWIRMCSTVFLYLLPINVVADEFLISPPVDITDWQMTLLDLWIASNSVVHVHKHQPVWLKVDVSRSSTFHLHHGRCC
jgi:hypothetical protein